MANQTHHTSNENRMAHVSRVVAAYIATHKIPLVEIQPLVAAVFNTFSRLETNPYAVMQSAKEPAVPIHESVQDDYIVCLEDGKRLQMLKRHLSTMYGMTLEQYRERWNLPNDCPMVSPNYARRRRAIAKNAGLGRSGRKARGRLDTIAT